MKIYRKETAMIHIDEKSSKPIYEQIFDEFTKLIVFEVFQQNSKLPSVRELASILRINPNTIQKGYKLLEDNEYIYSIQGKGSFVNSNDITKNKYKSRLKLDFENTLKEFLKIGTTKDDLILMVEDIIEGVEVNA